MKKRTKWLLALMIVIVVLVSGMGIFFFYNFDAYFMEAKEIPTGMDPEETMIYYSDAWDKGDYKTMEKMWLEIPAQVDSLREVTRGVCSVNVDRIWAVDAEEDGVESQEGYADAVTVHVDHSMDTAFYAEYSYYNVWYLVKEKEGDDWRIVESSSM